MKEYLINESIREKRNRKIMGLKTECLKCQEKDAEIKQLKGQIGWLTKENGEKIRRIVRREERKKVFDRIDELPEWTYDTLYKLRKRMILR